MKKLLLLLACFIFAFQACEKEESSKLNNAVAEENEFDILDGILSFDKGADFFALGEKLSAMSQEQLLAWEDETGFVSMRTEIETAFEMLDKCKTIEEYNDILSKNADIIKIEDEQLQPMIKSCFHTLISNRKGYYIVEDILYRVTPEGIYTCNTKSTELIEKAIANGLNEEDLNVAFVPKVEENTFKSATGATYVWGHSAWSDKRSCYAHIYLDEVWFGNEPRTFRYFITCYSNSQGKNLFGGTKLYESAHYTSGLTVRLDAPLYLSTGYNGPQIAYGQQVETLNAYGPTPDTKTYTWWNSIRVGNDITMTQSQIQSLGTPKTTIEYANGRFWTRGSGSHIYAEIRFGW